jgi:hypothetical protein
MTLFVRGTLTNNGTISMTARGAIAAGQNVHLWRHESGTFETVPAAGAAGGAAITSSASNNNHRFLLGNAGGDGQGRRTGGGGTGAHTNIQAAAQAQNLTTPAGSAGTSYSGGTGSGGVISQAATVSSGAATANGGAGGAGRAAGQYASGGLYRSFAGGGVGNNTGASQGNNFGTEQGRANGTGGLLVIYGNQITNTGVIEADGVSTSFIVMNVNVTAANGVHGGASGGGSVNIFWQREYTNSGTVRANGGVANRGSITNSGLHGGSLRSGGRGGNGSITVTRLEAA